MPRLARKRSEFGIYHIIVRGVNRQNIFIKSFDYEKFLEILARVKKDCGFLLFGYCLMRNHVHLLIKEHMDDISLIMKRIGTSYAMWFNLRYERTGHLFQNRFRSECVEDDSYLLTVIRYILQNPLKAGLVDNPGDYKWSSSNAYYGLDDNYPGLTDIEFILKMFDDEKAVAIKDFQKFVSKPNNDQCIDYREPLKDSEILRLLTRLMSGKPISELKQMSRHDRNRILRELKSIDGTTVRQIARVTGLGYSIVCRA